MTNLPFNKSPVFAVIGLGYVGLPLAVEFGKRFRTIGLDLSPEKVEAYLNYIDPVGEISQADLRISVRLGGLEPTTNPSRLSEADYLIVAVPTPVDSAKIPDFRPLISASEVVGAHMKPGATVIYESTVYPGATEEICIPVLERHSGMKWKEEFHVGYSPERINPGDKQHTLTKIIKVISGDTPETLEKVATLYGEVISAGTHKASSIKVAEAAKVIENTQRDLNIALMNELAIICDRIGIQTSEVLSAAGTKWNFLKFTPGLVGGHCIGVDPYYLTHKAEMLGYHPQVILAGRRINDGMGKFIAEKTVKMMIQNGTSIKDARVVLLGLTFKEDCPDLRNSKVIDVLYELRAFGCDVSIHDPLADSKDAAYEYGIELTQWDHLPSQVDALVIAVAHEAYRSMPVTALTSCLSPSGIIVDVKGVILQSSQHRYWRL
jgi:UDP-N-acetyl-D-galactosamine dehydrogenase